MNMHVNSACSGLPLKWMQYPRQTVCIHVINSLISFFQAQIPRSVCPLNRVLSFITKIDQTVCIHVINSLISFFPAQIPRSVCPLNRVLSFITKINAIM